MMSLLIISAVFPPEPVVSAMISSDIASTLSKSHVVEVICPKPTRPKGFNFSIRFEPDNYKLLKLNSHTSPQSSIFGRMRESFDFGIKCSKYIANNHNEISLIYANTWPLFAQFLTVRIAKKKRIKIIIHVQDLYPESLLNKLPGFLRVISFKLLLPLDKYILNNSDKIITISERMSSHLIRTRKINADKVFIVSNYQDVDPFLEFKNYETPTDRFTFMYLGNIGPVAGIDSIIDAFKLINTKDTKLCIAGSGSMKEFYKSRVINENIDNVEFVDVPLGMVPEIQSHADVLILPMRKGTSSSSIPSKLPAYMFSAKPIIACVDIDSDTAKAITDSGCGWVVPSDCISGLSNIMQACVKTERSTLTELGNNGFEYAYMNYSKNTNLTKLLNIILSN